MDWGKVFEAVAPAVIQGTMSAGAGIYGQKAAGKAADKKAAADFQAYKDKAMFERDMAREEFLWKQQHGAGGGGGGGGGGGPFTGFTDPQKVSAMQEQNAMYLSALKQLMDAYRAPLMQG